MQSEDMTRQLIDGVATAPDTDILEATAPPEPQDAEAAVSADAVLALLDVILGVDTGG